MSPQYKRSLSRIALAVALIVPFSRQASAEETTWYTTVQFGQAETEARLGSVYPKVIDDDSLGGSIALGYRISRHLAVQAGYHDFGGHRGSGSPCQQSDDACIERLAALELCAEGFSCTEIFVGMDADEQGVSLALLPEWPLSDRFAVFGKAGILAWRASLSAESFGHIETFSGDDLLMGAGLRYDLSNRLGMLLEHERLDLDLRSTTVGLLWRF